MPYTPQVWTDDVTEVDSDHMSHIEDGILTGVSAAEAIATAKGQANGYASLGADGKVPAAQLGPFVGAAPPANPQTGDLWLLPLANGVNWVFRYNAASASAYKWEFYGGPPAYVYIATDETLGFTGVWANLPTVGPDFVAPRTGDYRCDARSYTANGGATSNNQIGVANASVGVTPIGAVAKTTAAVGMYSDLSVLTLLAGLALGNTARVHYQSSAAGSLFGARTLSVLPVRVS
jgi:hypothetical protein